VVITRDQLGNCAARSPPDQRHHELEQAEAGRHPQELARVNAPSIETCPDRYRKGVHPEPDRNEEY
jgi:hypothetical protein